MLDEPRLAGWQIRCLEALRSVEGVAPALFILNADARRSWFKRFLRVLFSRDFPFAVYSRLFVHAPCLEKRELPRDLDGVPVLSCRVTTKGRFSQYFTEEDLEAIRGHRLDFILRFGFNIIRGGILEAARFGVWSFHHGDERRYRGSPPCFWEVYHSDPVTGTILQRLTDRLDGGIVLKRHYYVTDKHSYTNNLSKALRAGAAMPAQVCRDIQNGNAGYLDDPPSATKAPIRYNPTFFRLVRFLGGQSVRMLKRLVSHYFLHETWNVGIVNQPIEGFLEDRRPLDIEWLPEAPRGRFYADCFGVARATGGGTVFLEHYDHRKGRGEIGCVDVPREGLSAALPPVAAIREPYHLSYPFLISSDGEIFCLPEATESGNLTLYRAVDFPRRWTREKVLVNDVRAVDPTVVHHDGLWWLFFCGDEPDIPLYVWYSDSLLGTWRPCENNPVKVDVRCSRSAGTPFIHGGALYRPVQDCSSDYGRRVFLMRVRRLTPTCFEEEPVSSVAPEPSSPYPHGLHTLSAFGKKTLVDGKRLRYTPFKLLYQLPRIGDSLRRFTGRTV
ncbi:MAG: hypothetical protein NTW26_04820 [bacterium]|nr:hypothetical protein [bacterium]